LTASSRTLPFRAWGGGGAAEGETGEKVSSTTVLNRRVHSFELAVERRATRLGRRVNDIATCRKDERTSTLLCSREQEERDDGQKLGVDAICVCWPRARSPMAQRVSELGRSVPLNTAVLCWGLAQGLPHTQLLVGELVRGGGSFVGMAGSPSARSLGVDLNSALSRRPHFQTTRPIRKQAYPSTPSDVFCHLFSAIYP
jgi:hypothetical protein